MSRTLRPEVKSGIDMAFGPSLRFILGDQVYHRWLYGPPPVEIKPQEISIPLAEEGARIPLIYGRVRARGPVLSWTGAPVVDTGNGLNGWSTGVKFYRMNMGFVIGIGMDDGAGANFVHAMWIGDNKAFPFGDPKETAIISEVAAGDTTESGLLGGRVVWYDGNAAQDPSATLAALGAGSVDDIPAYRKYISIALYNEGGQWIVGSSPNVPAYSFEVSSYRDAGSYPGTGIYGRCGQDSNPINVIWDLLKCTFGKLGMSTDWIDVDSFGEAAATLYGESHGYSRYIEDVRLANEIIAEILQQIDGVMYVDETSRKLKIKLIRADYDPATVPHITKDSGCEMQNFAAGGRANLVNRIVLKYTDASNHYQDNTELAQSPGNRTGHNVQSQEVVHMPGVTHAPLAARLAGRELAWRRAAMKMSMLVDRSFVRRNPGDVVKVTWQKPDISGLMFRVAGVYRGTLIDRKIRLDLIQDVSYVHRGRIPEPPSPIDTGVLSGGVIGGVMG